MPPALSPATGRLRCPTRLQAKQSTPKQRLTGWYRPSSGIKAEFVDVVGRRQAAATAQPRSAEPQPAPQLPGGQPQRKNLWRNRRIQALIKQRQKSGKPHQGASQEGQIEEAEPSRTAGIRITTPPPSSRRGPLPGTEPAAASRPRVRRCKGGGRIDGGCRAFEQLPREMLGQATRGQWKMAARRAAAMRHRHAPGGAAGLQGHRPILGAQRGTDLNRGPLRPHECPLPMAKPTGQQLQPTGHTASPSASGNPADRATPARFPERLYAARLPGP